MRTADGSSSFFSCFLAVTLFTAKAPRTQREYFLSIAFERKAIDKIRFWHTAYYSFKYESTQVVDEIFVCPKGIGLFICHPSCPPVFLEDQRQIKNNRSLRPSRLCGEKLLPPIR